MMTSFRNLSKDFLNCYQTKTDREMLQHDFPFVGNLMTFFLPKKKKRKKKREIITYSFSIFIFSIFVQKFKPKKKEKENPNHDMCI
jgi:hypothetical protein